jgi:hypothetical protein
MQVNYASSSAGDALEVKKERKKKNQDQGSPVEAHAVSPERKPDRVAATKSNTNSGIRSNVYIHTATKLLCIVEAEPKLSICSQKI